MSCTVSDIEYLEQSIKRLTEELKARGYLSQEFQFLTKAELEANVEWHIDQFLKAP